jgi:cytochrome c biogenesis protein CcmG/thiol:disulfide interchange protein DsbE
MSGETHQPAPRKSIIGRRLALALPLAGLAVMGGGFALMLRRMGQGNFDPHALPSQLIGKRVPDFTLPGLDGGLGITGAELQHPKGVMLVNFFASWCEPCLEEMGVLAGLAQAGLTLWGIGYKDSPTAVRRFLADAGNPFARVALDQPGRVAINWGVYGVPETYLIDAGGIVRWRYAGPLTPDVLADDLRPLLRRAAAS